jgi:L-rhamnose isomerase/sugar isomerase
MAGNTDPRLAALEDDLAARGIDVQEVKRRLKHQAIEQPSWGFSDSGTRFGVFRQPGAAATIHEKLQDAAQVHKYTGIAPSVALHVLWDRTDDLLGLKAYAESLGLRLGAINPNVFQDQEYKLGSVTNEDPAIRRKALQHILDSVEMARQLGSRVISLWFADGTSYPGQGDFRRRKAWMTEALQATHQALSPDMVMLVEYKFYEPGCYHTDIADWGMSAAFCRAAGPQAKVLVDLGHHPLATNIEHIVAFLLDEGMLGGFHLNSRRYGDDDLTVGSSNPYELYLIYCELAAAETEPNATKIEYMVDQCANLKPKIEDIIQTIMAAQTAYAKALILDRKALRAAQQAGDIVLAERTVQQAFTTDVEPLLRQVREEMGCPPDPLQAFRASGYLEKISKERGLRSGTGGGLGQG